MYGEWMIGINMLFNYAILSFTNKIGNHQTSRRRLWSASFTGALFVTLFPHSAAAIIFAFLLMTYIAFGQTVSSWKNSLLAVLIAAFFAGGLLTLFYSHMSAANHRLYVVLAVGLVYSSLYFVKVKWLDARTDAQLLSCTFDSELTLFGRTVPLAVFIDTGNHCKEPISGAPVHFVSYSAVQAYLPEQFAQLLESWESARSPDLSIFPSAWQKKLRLIRLQTVQGASWAAGIKYDVWEAGGCTLPAGYIVLTKEQRHYPQGASAILHVSVMDLMK